MASPLPRYRPVALVLSSALAAWPAAAEDLVALGVPYESPFSVERHVLTRRAPPEVSDEVRCFYYPTYTVKELDTGQHGDDAISVTPTSADAARPACGRQDDPGEIVLDGGREGYFLGARGGFLAVISTLGAGTTPFIIYDGRSAKRLYADELLGDARPTVFAVTGDVLTLRYIRGFGGSCSVITGGRTCWAQMVRTAHLPGDVSRRPPPVETCHSSYEAWSRKGHTRFTDAEPSYVGYEVTMTLGRSRHTTVLQRGPFACEPSL